MTDVSPKIISEAQKFTPDAVITLFDLDLRELGGPIFHFTPHVVASGEAGFLKWRGVDYIPMPIQASGFEMSSSGQFPRPKLTIGNVLNTLQPELKAYGNLTGATVTRWQTFAKHLDNGDDPDPDVHFPVDIFKVDRKSSANSIMIEFELSSSLDQEGVQLPRRQILRSTCTHTYRIWNAATSSFDYSRATCPYAGDAYFDEQGNIVSLPQDDAPSKLVGSCCKKRFPNQALPTRAFPGVGRFR